MAKRFTDTDKWQKLWFSELPPKYKLFWIYLLDMVDNAGIYDVNFKLAEFQLGMELDYDQIIKDFGKYIVKVKDTKWFIPKFVEFQYGELNPANKAHLSVINKLSKYNLENYAIMGHTSPLNTPKDKIKRKRESKRKPKDLAEVKEYLKEKNIKDVDALKFFSFYETNGWVQGKNKPIKNWKMCINTWRSTEEETKSSVQITFSCPNHPEISRTASKDTWAFCPICKERLVDIDKIKLEKAIKK